MPKYILEYDNQSDAAYIKIRSSKVEESIEAGNDIIMDLDKEGRLIGIEILNFSKNNINLRDLVTREFRSIISVIK